MFPNAPGFCPAGKLGQEGSETIVSLSTEGKIALKAEETRPLFAVKVAKAVFTVAFLYFPEKF